MSAERRQKDEDRFELSATDAEPQRYDNQREETDQVDEGRTCVPVGASPARPVSPTGGIGRRPIQRVT